MENFNHLESVKFVKTLLASYGITDYTCYEYSYDTKDEYYYGSKTHYDTCKLSELPAPYGIGHTMIEIVNGHISIRLIMSREEKLTEIEKQYYHKDSIKCYDIIWVIDLPDNKMLDERWEAHKSGYNLGLPINEKTINQFYELFKIIYGTKYKTNFLVQLAASNYEENRNIKDFINLVAHAWNLDENLWSCVNKWATQWGEISKITLCNQYEDLKY